MTRRNIVVGNGAQSWADVPVEMCEHKGVGHPDSVTDAVCEAAALALVAAYQREAGGPLHFNVDKGLLVGGRSAPRFGGGEVLDKPKLIVCGRASNPGGALDIEAIVLGAARAWLDENLQSGAALFRLFSEVRQGSASLQQVLAGAPRANDTSFGVGYAPLSPLEDKVLALATTLASPALRAQVPAAGEDFKVMGLRRGGELSFTVAIALVDKQVGGCDEYFAVKERIRSLLDAEHVLVNRLDDPSAKDEAGVYVTVTGLSAEMGDDGQVGRGNRVNGLITPGRPMSLEAAAGKNPHAHVGKIYNVLAHRIARAICAQVPEVEQASVRLLSAIGAPLDQPQVAAVEIRGDPGAAVRDRVRGVVDAELDSIPALVGELARGRLRVF